MNPSQEANNNTSQRSDNSNSGSIISNIATGIRDAIQGLAAGVIFTIPGAEWTVQTIQYNLTTPGTYCHYDYLRETNPIYGAAYSIGNIITSSLSAVENPAGGMSIVTSTGEIITAAGSVTQAISSVAVISNSSGGSSSQGTSKPSLKPFKNNKEANKIAEKLGYDGAEDLKEAFVGSQGSKFNIKYDTKTNEIFLESIKTGVQVPTGLYKP